MQFNISFAGVAVGLLAIACFVVQANQTKSVSQAVVGDNLVQADEVTYFGDRGKQITQFDSKRKGVRDELAF